MATATKKFPPASSPQPRAQERASSPSLFDRFARMIDAIYHFLASLKLAVVSISTLAATLAYATFFESWYGAGAAQQYIYRSPGFAILLAFLGMNILCAALIRYPWKKRQTGFVVTHAGLLTLLLGSYYSVRTADEGQVGMVEGDVKGELVRIEYPVIRVWEIDPHTGERTREIDLPFRPGPFEWGPGKPRSPGFLDRALSLVSLGLSGPSSSTEEVLSQPGDPFRFVVKEHLPASVPAVAHVADPDGAPMVRIGLQFKGPGMPKAQDAFRSEEDHWFATERKFYRVVRSTAASASGVLVRRPPRAGRRLPQAAGGFRVPRASRGSAITIGRERTLVFDWALDGQTRQVGRLARERPHRHTLPGDGVSDLQHRAGANPGRRLDSHRRVQDPVGQGRADHPHGTGQLADGPERDSSDGRVRESRRRVRWRRSTTWSPQRSIPRPTAASARSRSWPGPTNPSITASSAGGRKARASFAPPGRWPRRSRSSPSAATPTCR